MCVFFLQPRFNIPIVTNWKCHITQDIIIYIYIDMEKMVEASEAEVKRKMDLPTTAVT